MDAFEGCGKLVAGTITPQERAETIQCACPGPVRVAACIRRTPWEHSRRPWGCRYLTPRVRRPTRKLQNVPPSGCCDQEHGRDRFESRETSSRKKSLHNAIAVASCVGGSTNAVLHLLAIARAFGVDDFTYEDFETVRRKAPVLCDMKPWGANLMEDLHDVGGVPGC